MYNAKLAPLLAESEMEEESPDAEGSQDDVGARGAKVTDSAASHAFRGYRFARVRVITH